MFFNKKYYNDSPQDKFVEAKQLLEDTQKIFSENL
jgi:hypothetical protein